MLAQQVSNTNVIDPADGIEPVPSLGLNTDFCDIIIEKKKKTVEKAKKHRTWQILRVNGSKLNQKNTAAVVCWKDKERVHSWSNSGIFWYMNKEIIDAKLWAIATGLDIAGKIMLKSPKIAITIFIDLTKVFNSLGQLSLYIVNPYLRKLICQKLSNLKTKEKSITLTCIFGHMRLVGYDKVD